MKSKTANAGLSKNLAYQPPGGISPMMWIGPGGQSPSMYEPAPNPPISKSAFIAPKTNAISKNFVEADKAARSANRQQGGQTHSVLRKGW